jgi:hypothetical protein
MNCTLHFPRVLPNPFLTLTGARRLFQSGGAMNVQLCYLWACGVFEEATR